MNTKDFLRLGVPLGQATRRATDFISKFILGGGDKSRLHEEVAAIVANPSAFVDDPLRGEFAKALLNAPPPPRAEPVKYRQWGEGLEHDAVMQMEKACLLPVSVAGALMPDAHVGYGLPIGGVLATDNAVIPYAVGVDIACRMKMTVLDIPLRDLEQKQDRLTRAIEAETRFGVGASFQDRRAHDVLDADWSVSPITKQNKDKAWSQLGTSGSGNHFVEFGLFTAHGKIQRVWSAGTYVALLSHSGSRGTGAAVCDHYSKIAFNQFPDLPSELKRLAWLSLDSQEGQEYWNAMELMGQYAAANHACIHRHIAENLGATGVARFGEPSQLRVEGKARHRRRGARGHRASQRRDAGGRRRAGHHSRLDGDAGICRERQRQRGIAELGLARRGPRDEPQGREREIQLEGREPLSHASTA